MSVTISKRSFLLLILDLGAITGSYSAGYYLKSGYGPVGLLDHPISYLALIIFPSLFYIFDLYYPYNHFGKTQTFVEVLFSVGIGGLLIASVSYLDRSFLLSRLIFVYTMTFLIPLIFLIRLLYDFFFQSRLLDKRALIVGTGPLACELVKVIKTTPHSGIEVIGLIYENKKPPGGQKNGIPVIGGVASLLSLIDWYKIELVVLAFDSREELSEAGVMSQLLARQVMVTSAIHLFEQINGDIPFRLLGSHYLLGLMSQVKRNPYLRLKRGMDLFFGGILFVFMAPGLFAASLLIFLFERKNPFFLQKRIGINGKAFELIKLRTMTQVKKNRLIATPLGKWIRRYHIDEIPQLFNVMKGDMSLIGPRPEIPYFVDRCRKKIPFYDAVFTVKPGLTGWAQCTLRHTTTVHDYEKKFRYNLYYLKNISLGLDLQVLLKTIRVVLLGKGK
ncbi:MAG: exopolysaccharide biosynthesis polyprenyl glycosylphosphotransferase [Candidatus Omnitrophica bacterium]|nr:exopolysaccharide biosynthesis polyprenyl glycosylphosphotransferase [Candidatus Omnitrophota bacterium]